MSDYALKPSTVISSQIIGSNIEPNKVLSDLITLIEHNNYGNNDPRLLDLHTSSLIRTDKFNEYIHTVVEYKRYIKALERLNKECVTTIACVNERLYVMRRKDPVIWHYAVRKGHEWPNLSAVIKPVATESVATESVATEPVTDLYVPAFDHKHFLRYMYKYTIEDAMNIINANNELFNTPYAEFMIYMYLGLKPKSFGTINPNATLAVLYRIKKEFINAKFLVEDPILLKYIDIQDDKFDIKEFATEILTTGKGFSGFTDKLLKSYFTYEELIQMKEPSNENTLVIALRKDM